MKKFLIATAASLMIFGGQADVQAATVDSLDEQTVETREMSKWSHFRDKHILHRETENERRDRKDWERRHGHHRPPPSHGHYGPPPPPPPPPSHGHYGPPPPPPPPPRW